MSFNLGSAVGEIRINYDGAGVQQAMGDLSALQSKGTQLMQAGAGVSGFGAAIGGALLGATNQAADFQFQMDAVNAAMGGLDPSQMEVVEQQALDMGAASKFSAGEVAGAMEQLAKSGLSQEQVTGGATQAVLDLAAATGESLVPSATAAAAAINLFGLDAEQSANVADIFTAGLNNSSATLADFQRGVNNLGPVMANLNQYANDGEAAFRDTAAAVAYFNAQGLKAADAGVSLARGLTNLADPTSDAAALMAELGIAAFDMEGNFIGFPSLFDQLNASMSGMSDQAREAALATIFGAEAADVMNKAVKEGGDPLREYGQLMESNGQAAEQAAIRQDNRRGALEQLGGAIQTAAINIGSTFLAPLQAVVEGITGLVNAFNSLPPEVQETIAQFAALTAALALLGGGAITAVGAVMRFGPAFAAAAAAAAPFLAILAAIAAAIGIGILAYKTNFLGFADAVDGAVASLKKFGAGFKAAFARGQAAGLNDAANAVQAFGDALLYATGIDITGFTDTLARGIQQFGDTMANDIANGIGILPALLNAAGQALRAMGFEELGQQLNNAAEQAYIFGEAFGASFDAAKAEGASDIEATIIGLASALKGLTGIDLTSQAAAIANALGAIGDAIGRLGSLLQSTLGNAFNALTQNVLPGAISALGNFLGTVKDVIGALLSGDLSQAGQIIGNALQSLGQWAGDAAQTIGDTLGSIDFGAIAGNIASGIGDALGNIASTVAGFVGGIDWSGVVSAIGTTLGAAFGTIGSFLTTVAGAIATALGDAIGGVASRLGAVNWSEVVSNIGTALGNAFTSVGDFLGNVASSIGTALSTALASVGDYLGELDFSGLVTTVTSAITSAFGGNAGGGGSFRGGGGAFSGIAQSLGSALSSALESIGGFLEGFDPSAMVTDVVAKIQSAFDTGGVFDFSALGESIKTALEEACGVDLSGAFDALGTAVRGVTQLLSSLAAGIGGWMGQVKSALEGIDESAALTVLADAVRGLIQQLSSLGAGVAGWIGGLTSALDSLPLPENLDGVAEALEGIKTAISGWTPPDLGGVAAAITGIGEAAANALQAVKDFFGALGGAAFTGGPEGNTTGDELGAFALQQMTGASDQAQQALEQSGDFATNFIAGIAASFAQADWSPVSTAINTGLQGVLTGGAGAQPGGPRDVSGGDGGLGTQLATSLVTSIAAAFTPEVFAPVKTAFDAALSAAFAATTGGGGQGGGQGSTIAASIIQSIAAGFGQQTATLTSALQAVVQAAGAGITGLETIGTQIITQIAAGFGPATGTIVSAMTAVMTTIQTVVTTGMTTITAAVTTGMTAVSAAITSGMAAASAAVTSSLAAITAQFAAFATAATTAGQTAGTGFSSGLTSGLAAAQSAAQAAVDAIIGILNSAADGAYAAGAAVGEGFAAGMEASLGRVQAAAAAMADAAAEGLAAAAQIASPSKVTMALGEQFGAGFALGIAGATPNAASSSYDMGAQSIRALAESLRANAESRVAHLRGLGERIRADQGMASGGGQPLTIETTGVVELDGQEMGTFAVETVLGGLIGAQRKGGKRRGRMQAS